MPFGAVRARLSNALNCCMNQASQHLHRNCVFSCDGACACEFAAAVARRQWRGLVLLLPLEVFDKRYRPRCHLHGGVLVIRQVHPWRLGNLPGSFARGHLRFVTGLAIIGAAAGEAADGEGFKEPCYPAAEWPSAGERSLGPLCSRCSGVCIDLYGGGLCIIWSGGCSTGNKYLRHHNFQVVVLPMRKQPTHPV